MIKHLSKQGDPATGTVYTSDLVAKQMVTTALQARLATEMNKKPQLHDYFEGNISQEIGLKLNSILRSLTYLDPSAGLGVFMKNILEVLINVHSHYGERLEKTWVSTHITGCDIHPPANEIVHDGYRLNIQSQDYFWYKHKADIIIGNPPYVRQEILEAKYKSEIHFSIKQYYSDLSISKRSDLYLYFLLKAIHDLKRNGICTFIVPNTWLDNDYGKSLRELLRTTIEMVSIQDSITKHFEVDVNTIILTIRKKIPGQSFLVEKDRKKEIHSNNQLPPSELGWSGYLLRSPAWLRRILADSARLTTLGKLFSISTGVITGNNLRYYSNKISKNCLPCIKSPRETNTILFNKEDAIYWIQTKNTPYRLKKAPILWTDLRGGKHLVVWNKDNLYFEHTFYGLTPHGKDITSMLAILNSSWVWLMVELFGRRNLGGGAIRLVKSGIGNIPYPKIANLEIPSTFLTRRIENWCTELEMPDRQFVDQQIFSQLHLDDYYPQMMKLLKQLMKERMRKATT